MARFPSLGATETGVAAPVQARIAVGLVLRVDARPPLQQQPRALAVAGVGREEQRRVALERGGVGVGAGVEQRVHHRRPALDLDDARARLGSSAAQPDPHIRAILPARRRVVLSRPRGPSCPTQRIRTKVNGETCAGRAGWLH